MEASGEREGVSSLKKSFVNSDSKSYQGNGFERIERAKYWSGLTHLSRFKPFQQNKSHYFLGQGLTVFPLVHTSGFSLPLHRSRFIVQGIEDNRFIMLLIRHYTWTGWECSQGKIQIPQTGDFVLVLHYIRNEFNGDTMILTDQTPFVCAHNYQCRHISEARHIPIK